MTPIGVILAVKTISITEGKRGPHADSISDRPYPIVHSHEVCGKRQPRGSSGHFDELEKDPDCPPRLDVLLDFSDMQSLPDTDQLVAVADQMRHVAYRVKFGACAIVAKSDIMFGIARMYTVYAEPHFATARVFRDFLQAEFWLNSMRNGTAK